MKPIIDFLHVTCLAWLAVSTGMVVITICHAVAGWRSRPPDAPFSDEFPGVVQVARELREAGREFATAIDRIDIDLNLSRHHRRRCRVDAGMPAVPGGGDHADA